MLYFQKIFNAKQIVHQEDGKIYVQKKNNLKYIKIYLNYNKKQTTNVIFVIRNAKNALEQQKVIA